MFSSSKILFATRASAASAPLSITAQPQNVTLSAGSVETIGQTTWATGTGYKRTMARWERSVDGINWYQETGYDSFSQSGGFNLSGGANPAQSGLKYRTYAYAYEEYTRLPNYMDQSGTPASNTYETLDNLGNAGGRLNLQSQGGLNTSDFAFIFLKGGQFKINYIQFVGDGYQSGSNSNCVVVSVNVGNGFVTRIRNIGSLPVGPGGGGGSSFPENYVGNIDFTASPGELMSFDFFVPSTWSSPLPGYSFRISSLEDVPYATTKVVSDPFTLTVTP